MKTLRLKTPAKKHLLQGAKEALFLSGVRCGSVIAKELIKSGWKNLDKLTDEVIRRVTGK